MTDREENYLSMMQKVVLFLDRYAARLADVPSVAVAHTELKLLITNLFEQASIGTSNLTGYASQKKRLRNGLQQLTHRVSYALVSYAFDQGLGALEREFTIAPSVLGKLRGNDLYTFSKRVYMAANEATMPANLAAYRVTPALLTDMNNHLTDYFAALSRPVEKRRQRKAANQEVKTYFGEARLLLTKRLDRYLSLYRYSDEKMYRAYIASRAINHTRSTTR